jgi:hypothetical protein
MTAAEPCRGELAPTTTYDRREWQWYPASDSSYLVDRDGSLMLAVTHGRRVIRTEIDWYAVQEEHDRGLPPGIRSFLLENEFDPDPDGPFRCVVGGMVEMCGCEAGRVDRRRVDPTSCKHRDALRALVAEGVI